MAPLQPLRPSGRSLRLGPGGTRIRPLSPYAEPTRTAVPSRAMAHPICPLCDFHQLTLQSELSMQACRACAATLGLVPMPPSRRPAGKPCARCSHGEFVRAIPREHSLKPGTESSQVSAPMFVTYVPEVRKGWLQNRAEQVAIESSGRGLLEVHICRRCGAVEWGCIDVDSIPIGPQYMTERVGGGESGPYR
jgi:hypothetical protein